MTTADLSFKDQILENAEFYKKSDDKPKKERKQNHPEYTYFRMMLYPEYDYKHKLVLEELEKNKTVFPKLIYINHNKDIYTEEVTTATGEVHHIGELKKPHVHVLFKLKKKGRPSTIIRHFEGLISYVEGVENEYASATYLTHENAKSRLQGKPIYSREELKGDKDFIRELFIQNTNSVLFNELLRVVKTMGTMFDVFEYLNKTGDEEKYQLAKKHAHLLVIMQNQQNNFYKNFSPLEQTTAKNFYKSYFADFAL